MTHCEPLCGRFRSRRADRIVDPPRNSPKYQVMRKYDVPGGNDGVPIFGA